MRTFTLSLTLLFVLNVGLLAQRPWMKCTWPDNGATPRLAIVSNTLLAYDVTTVVSYDQGVSWSATSGINGTVRCAVDFPSISGSIALTQENTDNWVHGYFTQNGSSWTHFDSVDISGRFVTGVAAMGLKYFIATTAGVVARGTVTSEVSLPGFGDPAIFDIASTPTVLAIAKESGTYISSNEGLEWNEVHPDGGVPPSTMVSELIAINGSIYAASDYGVLLLQESNATWQPVGKWPIEMSVPVISSLSGDVQNLIALVRVNNQSQMFRLSSTDTAWSASAYPLPGLQPATVVSALVVDNGWAVTYHNPLANTPDSMGVYRFDLNDFTDVVEQHANEGFSIRSDQNGIFFVDPPATTFRVQVFDLLLRSVFETSVEGGMQSVSLPSWVNGFLCVQVTDATGRSLRGTVLR